MRSKWNAAVARLLRGPRASRLLERLGIDARRYWLLTDLFGLLAERRELFNQLGRDGVTLELVSRIYTAVSALIAVALIVTGATPAVYLATCLGITAFILLSLLISETSNSLLNPVEALMLAHQPIDGATYTAAKLSHLVRILLYLVPGLNGIPALAALLLKGCPWYYPLVHLAAAFAVGLLVALSCCAVFGWLMRFVSPRRLKTVGQMAEMSPWLAYLLVQMGRATRLPLIYLTRWWPAPGAGRTAVFAGLGLLAAAIMWAGLRALSGDYLARVAAISQGRTKKVAYRKRWSAGAGIGSPAVRAGFEYVWRMMWRDWHFRRQMIPMIPLVVVPAAALVQGWRVSPFSGKFTMMHVVPHAFGILLFLMCAVMEQGADYKGVWIFLLAPGGAIGRFARGVYLRLWLSMVAIPHAVLLALLVWAWGARDAVLFSAYSLALASCYLGAELRLIDGLPFSKPAKAAQNAYIMPLMMAGAVGMALVVGLQYFLVFRSAAAVAAVTVAAAAGAWLLTRSSLEAFAIAIRYNLGLETSESQAFYTEIL
jgi:hypothetical protein